MMQTGLKMRCFCVYLVLFIEIIEKILNKHYAVHDILMSFFFVSCPFGPSR